MKTIRMNEDGYTIASQGNGLCCEVRRDADGATFFLQGEDAARFREEWDAAAERMAFAAFLSAFDYDGLFRGDDADPAP